MVLLVLVDPGRAQAGPFLIFNFAHLVSVECDRQVDFSNATNTCREPCNCGHILAATLVEWVDSVCLERAVSEQKCFIYCLLIGCFLQTTNRKLFPGSEGPLGRGFKRPLCDRFKTTRSDRLHVFAKPFIRTVSCWTCNIEGRDLQH